MLPAAVQCVDCHPFGECGAVQAWAPPPPRLSPPPHTGRPPPPRRHPPASARPPPRRRLLRCSPTHSPSCPSPPLPPWGRPCAHGRRTLPSPRHPSSQVETRGPACQLAAAFPVPGVHGLARCRAIGSGRQSQWRAGLCWRNTAEPGCRAVPRGSSRARRARRLGAPRRRAHPAPPPNPQPRPPSQASPSPQTSHRYLLFLLLGRPRSPACRF